MPGVGGGGENEEVFERCSIRHHCREWPEQGCGRMRARLSQHLRRCVRRRRLGHRRTGMERMPCRSSPPTSMSRRVPVASEYAGLLPTLASKSNDQEHAFRIDRVNGHKRLCRPTVLFFLVRVLVQSSCNLLRNLRGLCRCDRPPFPGQQLLVMSLERKIVRLESLIVCHSVSSQFPERTRRPDVGSATNVLAPISAGVLANWSAQ